MIAGVALFEGLFPGFAAAGDFQGDGVDVEVAAVFVCEREFGVYVASAVAGDCEVDYYFLAIDADAGLEAGCVEGAAAIAIVIAAWDFDAPPAAPARAAIVVVGAAIADAD